MTFGRTFVSLGPVFILRDGDREWIPVEMVNWFTAVSQLTQARPGVGGDNSVPVQ